MAAGAQLCGMVGLRMPTGPPAELRLHDPRPHQTEPGMWYANVRGAPDTLLVRDPTAWTIFQQDGRNHLGLW